MGTTNRRLQVDVVGNVSGFTAAMGRVNSGITQVGQGFKYATGQGGAMENQLRAIGTTARYALAGQLVFGITGAISKLSQFQVQLGNIQTVATQLGGQEGLKNIGSLGDSLIDISTKTITPVQTLTDTVTKLYSSISSPVNTKTIEDLTELLAKTARVSQVANPGDLVSSLIGGVNAYGLPSGSGKLQGSVLTLANQFKRVLQASINVTGEDYSTYAGNLYKSAAQDKLTPAQTGALVIQASQFGGSASSIVQNLSQMLVYLKNPKTKVNQAAYRAAGIDPNNVSSMNGYDVITKLINHAIKLGGVKGAKSMTSDDIQNLPNGTTLAGMGISGAGAKFIEQAFGRIQSQRTLVTLVNAQMKKPLDDWVKYVQSGGDGAKEIDKSFQRFADQAPLSAFSNALGNATLHLTKDFATYTLNPAARVGNKAVTALGDHKDARVALEALAGTMLAGRALKSIFPNSGIIGSLAGKKGIGRLIFGKVGSKAGGLAGTAIEGEEAANIASGGAVDGTRSNPFWVVISPWSWQFGNQGPGGIGFGPSGPTPNTGDHLLNDLKKAGGGAALAAGLRTVGLRGALVVGGTALDAATVGLGAYKYFSNPGKKIMVPGGDKLSSGASWAWAAEHPVGDVQKTLGDIFGHGNGGISFDAVTAVKSNHLFDGLNLNQNQGNSLLYALSHLGGPSAHNVKQLVEVAGQAQGEFKIQMVDANGNVIKTVTEKGVPVKIWTKAGHPQAQGKPGSRKGQA